MVPPPEPDEAGEGSEPTPGPLGHRWLVLVGTAVAVLVLDQLSKAWAVDRLADGPIDVVWTLRLRLVENRGAAFSIVGGGGLGPVISALAIVVVAVLVLQVRDTRSTWSLVAVGMIVGGALGNLVDRATRGDDFLHGAVIDFIDVQWWPVWNVADMGVVVGGVLLVLATLWGPRSPTPDDDPEVSAGDAEDGSGEP